MLSTGTGTFIRVLICAQATERLLDGCPNMSSFRKNLTGKAAGQRDPGRGPFYWELHSDWSLQRSFSAFGRIWKTYGSSMRMRISQSVCTEHSSAIETFFLFYNTAHDYVVLWMYHITLSSTLHSQAGIRRTNQLLSSRSLLCLSECISWDEPYHKVKAVQYSRSIFILSESFIDFPSN